MKFRRPIVILVVALAIVVTIAQLKSQRKAFSSSPPPRQLPFETASLAEVANRLPFSSSTRPLSSKKPAVPESPIVPKNASNRTAAPLINDGPIDLTDSNGDLRSSQTRLDAIDQLASEADEIFSAAGDEADWSVNQQKMDQEDYRLTDDGTVITKWYGSNQIESSDSVRAEEAQFNNGEVIDRWFDANGNIQQVLHQYDKENSFSIYRYPSGETEATRIIRDGNEIFTRYSPDGGLIERIYTPAASGADDKTPDETKIAP